MEWNKLSEIEQDKLCREKDFDYKLHWNKLTDDQKFFVICYNPSYDYIWFRLTDIERDFICCRSTFEYDRYWNELSETQKYNVICHNKNFDYKSYWNKLSDYLKYECALKDKNFDYNGYQIDDESFNALCKNKKNFNPKWEKLNRKNKENSLLYNS